MAGLGFYQRNGLGGWCYSYSKELGQLLFKPLYAAMPENSSLIFTSYQEGFFFI